MLLILLLMVIPHPGVAKDICHEHVVLKDLGFGEQTVKIDIKVDLKYIQQAMDHLETSGSKAYENGLKKVEELRGRTVNESLKILTSLDHLNFFNGKLLSLVKGQGPEWISKCHTHFADLDVDAIGRRPMVGSMMDVYDIRSAMKQLGLTHQIVKLMAKPTGWVSPLNHFMLTQFADTAEYNQYKSTKITLLHFKPEGTIDVESGQTALFESICMSDMPAQIASPKTIKSLVFKTRAFLRKLNVALEHLKEIKERHGSLPTIPTPTQDMTSVTLSPTYLTVTLYEKLKLMEEPSFWTQLAIKEIALIEKCMDQLDKLNELLKEDVPGEMAIYIPKNDSESIAQAIGAPLEKTALFRPTAKDALQKYLYGTAKLKQRAHSGNKKINIYRIFPLIVNKNMIVRDEAMVISPSKKYTLKRVPSDDLTEVWNSVHNTACADYLLYGHIQEDGHSPCPMTPVTGPFVTSEECNNNFPATLILSAPWDLKVTVACPGKPSSTTMVLAGNTRFPQQGSCTMYTEKGEVIFQPSILTPLTVHRSAAPPAMGKPHDGDDDDLLDMLPNFQGDNTSLLIIFVAALIITTLMLCMCTWCMMWVIYEYILKKKMKKLTNSRCLSCCPCGMEKDMDMDDQEMAYLNGTSQIARKWADEYRMDPPRRSRSRHTLPRRAAPRRIINI